MFAIDKVFWYENVASFSNMQSSHHFRYQSKLRIRDIEDDAEKIRRLKVLPKGLHLPYEVKNPWARPIFEEDFVLITEFSENEGPTDVLTIPTNGGGAFDKNAFALHVMSVDFQSQNRTAEFNISEDTQMVLSDKKAGMSAFVHHFTLYDIHARGYVRPFCMSYITNSKRKILSCMNTFVREFQRIAMVFHKGNRAAFSADLEQRLQELCNINEQLSKTWPQERKPESDEKPAHKQKEIYQQTFNETRKVIDALRPHLHGSVILEKLKKLETQADVQDESLPQEAHQEEDSEVIQINVTEDVKDNTESFVVVNENAVKRAHSLSSLEDMKIDNNEIEYCFKSFAPTYLQNMKELRNLDELCGIGAKDGINRLRNFVQSFSREDIAIAIEKTESSIVDPVTSLLSFGRNIVVNFTSNVDLKKHSNSNYNKGLTSPPFVSVLQRKLSLGSGGSACSTDSFKSCLDDAAFDSRRSSDGTLPRFAPLFSVNAEDYDTFDSDTTPETPSSEFSHLQWSGGSGETLSLGSYHVLDENCLQRQMSEIHVHEPRLEFLTRKSYSLENLPSMINTDTNQDRQGTHKRPDRRSSSFRTVNKMYEELTTEDTRSKPVDVTLAITEESKGQDKRALRLAKPLNRNLKIERPGSAKLSLKRQTQSTRNVSPPVRCYAEEICRPQDTQNGDGGSNMLEFRNNYSFGVHLVYALLVARPVVILAKPEHQKEVRALISTLRMFVSDVIGCHSGAVMPWRKQPLHITDLPCLRLVGLCKSRKCRISKSVERYVSILDYDTGVIASPAYKGIFLKAVFSYKNSWPSNAAFLAYIHSVLLELACKGYVLYYTCTLGPALQQNRAYLETKHDVDEVEILNRLGVHFSDAAIVQHFVEMIKQQQIQSYFPGSEELNPQTIISDLAKCAKYRNLAPIDPKPNN